jgi:CHASE3 domain sensor protein
MRVATRLSLMATGVISVILLIGFTSYMSVSELIKANKMVSHSREVLQELNMLMHNLSETVCSQRNYLISGEEIYLDSYRSSIADTIRDTDQVIVLVADSPKQSFRARQLDSLIKERLASLEVTTKLYQDRGREAAFDRVRHGRSLQFRNALHKAIDEMKKDEISLLQSRAEEMHHCASSTQWTIIAGVILGLSIAALFNYLFARYILNCIRQLIRAADNIRYGRFDLWASINSNDEFADLASAFNTVGQQLLTVAKRATEQESKVEQLESTAEHANEEIEQLRTKLLSASQISHNDQGLLDQQNEYTKEILHIFASLNDIGLRLERITKSEHELIYRIGCTTHHAEENAILLIGHFKAEQEFYQKQDFTKYNAQLADLQDSSRAFEDLIASLDLVAITASLEHTKSDPANLERLVVVILERVKTIVNEAKSNRSRFYDKIHHFRNLIQTLTMSLENRSEKLAKQQILIEGFRAELAKESDLFRQLKDNGLEIVMQDYGKLMNSKNSLPEKIHRNLDEISKSARQRQSLVSESVSAATELLATVKSH